MTRRTDFVTAERISIALLTRAAFGTDAGLRNALLAGLNVSQVTDVFARDRDHVRKDQQGIQLNSDRRMDKREASQ